MTMDIGFDFRTDATGKDPDTHSPMLRRYHRLLWSKPLPSGASCDLSETAGGVQHHRSSFLCEEWRHILTACITIEGLERLRFPETRLVLPTSHILGRASRP
jgi:hypothetical protein